MPAGFYRGWLAAIAIVASLALQVCANPAWAEAALVLSNGSQELELSLDDLETMPQKTVRTTNDFVDGPVSYRGPLVRDVLARVGLDKADSVRLMAANDYYVDIPTQDFRDYDAILALEADGERLSPRDKGPIWLMYPISDYPALRDPIYTRRLIWQVVRISSP